MYQVYTCNSIIISSYGFV